MTHPEGDILPFKMTAEQRRAAIGKSASHSPEHDLVQLFRAKPTPKAPKPTAVPSEKRVLTRKCSCCGGQVKVKVERARRIPDPPQKRWWLYYGPGHMTGGFRTKQEAKNWYLNGGR